MDTIGEKDCNSKELSRLLVGSVQRLLNLNQWNDFIRLQAINDPFRFIDEVAKHGDCLEKEDEGKGNYHLRITGITPEGRTMKINCIKIMRQIMGWGLADSKVSYEALPGNGSSFEVNDFVIITRAFMTYDSLKESREWQEFSPGKHLFVYDTPRFQNMLASVPYSLNKKV